MLHHGGRRATIRAIHLGEIDMNILDVLQKSGEIGSIARELGVDEQTAATGAAALLPAILGGFAKQQGGAASGGDK